MYEITEADRIKTEQGFFESLDPLKLKELPSKAKKKYIALQIIAKAFDENLQYNEKQVNEILEAIHADYVTLRRDLIDYGFLGRERDGSRYWLKKSTDGQ
ncbi:MAG: DUF2087 domain-containing protein [Bacilli bacterium]|nr:DUF2087 domain-containing protein [Bacilli bacterium]MBN2697139.1 DUF2087 domain-containing protein [Bacilli bacterium]